MASDAEFVEFIVDQIRDVSGGLRKLVKPISDKTPKFTRKGFLS